MPGRQLVGGDAADQRARQRCRRRAPRGASRTAARASGRAGARRPSARAPTCARRRRRASPRAGRARYSTSTPRSRQHVGERVVLLAGPLHPQHVVEQQVGAVRRGQALELEVGPVQHHLPQPPDLGVDVEASVASASRSSARSEGDEHRARGQVHDGHRGAAEREPRQPGAAVAVHRDHRGRKLLRVVGEGRRPGSWLVSIVALT